MLNVLARRQLFFNVGGRRSFRQLERRVRWHYDGKNIFKISAIMNKVFYDAI